MKNRKTIKETKEITYTESITCDICKQVYRGTEWGAGVYEVLEIIVSKRTGRNYPEGGSGELVTFDVCPKCFDERLIPAMKALGAEPTAEEWDW